MAHHHRHLSYLSTSRLRHRTLITVSALRGRHDRRTGQASPILGPGSPQRDPQPLDCRQIGVKQRFLHLTCIERKLVPLRIAPSAVNLLILLQDPQIHRCRRTDPHLYPHHCPVHRCYAVSCYQFRSYHGLLLQATALTFVHAFSDPASFPCRHLRLEVFAYYSIGGQGTANIQLARHNLNCKGCNCVQTAHQELNFHGLLHRIEGHGLRIRGKKPLKEVCRCLQPDCLNKRASFSLACKTVGCHQSRHRGNMARYLASVYRNWGTSQQAGGLGCHLQRRNFTSNEHLNALPLSEQDTSPSGVALCIGASTASRTSARD